MRTNFEIEDNYAVKLNGVHIDLHNNFDFIGISEIDINKTIVLEFRKSKGDWIHKNEFDSLIFTFKNVSYKYLKDGEIVDYPADAKCLGEITFFSSELRDINDSITIQTFPNDNDDIIFFFEDSRVIRLNSEYAELETRNDL